ncbi:Cubilin [Portunus trituberculatus]|uniref:Cubilin n=1 Tax=Portunus trituberculatus TaxID=210409 RepID=A0A5B7CLK0_PORTR|nr:Cubilin [Portunus trituberculatus]
MQNAVRSLQGSVGQLSSTLDPLVNNVSRLASQVSLMTPESSRQRLQQLNTLLASLQQTTSQTQLSLQDVTQQMLPTLQQTVAGLSVEVNSLPELRNRLQALEIRINGTTTSTGTVNITSGNYLATLTTLQREVFQIKSQLMVDECASGPCRNGGICIDGYLKFTCLCPKGWQGGDCNLDSDECVQYAGTDLGCQNGATCINFPGSFRCLCPPGKFGVLCDQQSSSCTQSSGSGLCGSHGNCVSSSGQHGYTCICDEGWKSQNQGNGPTCVDVDECASQMPHCSSSPAVQCINYPGGFTCGPCPQGFSGNGFVCNDIDECQINNGGCSPFSQCYNTYGGRRCGPCATGYTGDGTTCTPSLSPCQTAQCHPLATCYENARQNCQLVIDMCANNPCLNGGTCTQGFNSFTCSCPSSHTGDRCQTENQLCGGDLHGNEYGSFKSPGYPGHYPVDRDCYWTITVSPGKRIKFHFPTLQLEHHPNCSFDFLEIRDGGSADSPLVRRACGTNLPSPVMSTGRQLYILFHSDFSVSRPGFRAVYQVACGGEYTGDTGLIRSPYNPQPYPGNRECIYLISQPVGKAIVLNFTFFDIEGSFWGHCSFDYIELRDGRRPTSPSLGRYCGPETHRPNPIVSTHNYMWIKFRTDGSVHDRGFVANYTTIDTTCGGVLTGITGVITSPNSPETYPTNTDCRWVLDLPPNYVIQITWQSFSLEHHTDCQYDYIEIFDNSSIAGQSQRMGSRLCGSTLPPIMTSSDNLVTIHFHSDSSVNHDGFSAVYHGLDATRACGGHYHTEMGIITSPNYPQNYPDSRICEWTITAVRGHQIHLNFLHMEVEPSTHCDFDAVEISQGNHAFVSFESDQNVRGKGFNISYTTLHDGCGGLFTAPEGSIHSPHYPNNYNNESDCTWTIKTDPMHVVLLNFTDFNVQSSSAECEGGFVQVYDGEDVDASLLLQHCGSSLPQPRLLQSTGSSLTVRLKADGQAPSKGFTASYKRGCGASIAVAANGNGEIKSPNFPNYYTSGLNCSWHLNAPEGSRMHLHIVHLDMHHGHLSNENCTYDYLVVLDGAFLDSPERSRFCGSYSPRPLVSIANHLTIHVVSDPGVYVSFRAVYSTLTSTCGGDLTSVSGELASPLYPEPYPVNLDCVWTIIAGPGNQLQLNFIEFDVEESSGCNQDYIEVHEMNPEGPLLLHNCSSSTGSTLPPSITVHDTLWIRFHSDGVSAGGHGFLASYNIYICGGTYNVEESRIFTSPGYPMPYAASLNCTWKIVAPLGHYLTVSFLQVEISSPDNNCTSINGLLKIRDINSTVCGGLVSGAEGEIRSPGYPHGYAAQRLCEWLITAPPGKRIKLEFLDFDIQSQYFCRDYMEVKGSL